MLVKKVEEDNYRLLLEVSKAMAAEKETTSLAQVIVDGITKLNKLGSAAVYLLEDDNLILEAANPPLPSNFPESLRVAALENYPHAGKAISSRKPVIVKDANSAKLTDAERKVCEQRQLRSILIIPLIYQDKSIGVLISSSVVVTQEFTEEDISTCQALTSHAALSITEAKMAEKQELYIAEIEKKNKSIAQSEKALRESEEKHRRLFETMDQGVIYQGAGGAIISANPAAEKILGLSFEQMQSKTTMDPHWQMIEEDGKQVPGSEHPTMIALQTGHKVGPVIRGIFNPHKNRHIWLSITATPLFKPGEKRPYQSYATFTDITERREAEERIEKEFKLRSALLDNIPNCIALILEKDTHKIVASNRAGREIGAVPGKTCFETSALRGDPCPFCLAPEMWESGQMQQVEVEYRGVWYEGIWAPLSNELYVHYIFNITERKKAEEDLRLQVKERAAVDTFTYSVSNDLQAPLRRIEGFSEAMLDDCLDQLNDSSRDYLNRIINQVSSMKALTDALLQLSKVVSREIYRETVNLSVLARAHLKELQHGEPGRQVEWKIADNLVAEGDLDLLNILLTSLLDNAWKFTSGVEKSFIEFGALNKDGRRVFYLQDNGAGFDNKYAEKLFIPFQKLHDDDDYPGIGIGLNLAYRIISRHKGEIWAKGDPGKGACFYFTLPK